MLLSGGYVITIFNNLAHVNACRLNEESHSIIPILVVFIIEIWRVVDVGKDNTRRGLNHVMKK